MKKLLLVVLMAAMPAFAADHPASEASIRELMTLTKAGNLLDKAYGQLDGIMQNAMRDAMKGKTLTPEQEAITAELRGKVTELFRTQLGWDQLEPSYINIYQKTLSQDEVNGMLKFYKTKAGKAVIDKLPEMTQSIVEVVMEKMQEITPQLRALQEEYTKRLVATEK